MSDVIWGSHLKLPSSLTARHICRSSIGIYVKE